jgi:hypothetical protein
MVRPSLWLPLFAGLLLLGCAASASAQVNVEAVSGQPFGVGLITLRAEPQPGQPLVPLSDDRFVLREAHGRVLYSALDQAPVRRLLRQFLDLQGPQQVTFFFLFRGDQPLDLTLYTPQPHRVTVRPYNNKRAYDRLLASWWKQYSRDVRRAGNSADYPLVVENYLLPTLSRRLNLEIPSRLDTGSSADDASDAMGLVFGSESSRAAIAREMLLGLTVDTGEANLELPEPPPYVGIEVPALAADLELEPLTNHVPEECFYLRFGEFRNYLWMREFLSRWGGDLRNMLVVRGFDYALNAKTETQLSLRESEMSKVVGPTVIADVAMIGSDLFMREGAGFGILFQARNNFALTTDIQRQYSESLKANDDCRLEKIEIDDRAVQYLHTPDNRIRSFYAVDGDFHLVTTSRSLVRRFYEAGAGKRPLARLAEFQHARSIMPLEREDTLFAYLSEPFMRQFVSPHYRVEMRRRTQSLIEMESLRLARLAAKAEDKDAYSVEELIASGLLPYGFGTRTDGSALVERDGRMFDSVRGLPGNFIPIADLETVGITRQELGQYQRFAEAFQKGWQRMDPIAIGVKRNVLNEAGLERMSIEAHVTPHVTEHFAQVAEFLGPPLRQRVAPVRGDVIAGEFSSSGKGIFGFFGGNGGPSNLLFGAIRDFRPPLLVAENTINPGLRKWELIRGYLGAWPTPGLLGAFLPQNAPVGPDGVGPASAFGLPGFAGRVNDFLVITFKRDVLGEVLPQLKMVDAQRPAQFRVRVEDASETQLYQAFSALGYLRSRQTSSSGARLMNQLADQLHVPPEDCLAVAEELTRAKLVCSLGGEFKLVELPGGLKLWTSTGLPVENQFVLSNVPENYSLPVLKWFRGANVAGLLEHNDLVLWADVDMQLEPIATGAQGGFGGGFTWPKWDSFSLPFSGSKQAAPKPMEELVPPAPEETLPPKK